MTYADVDANAVRRALRTAFRTLFEERREEVPPDDDH